MSDIKCPNCNESVEGHGIPYGSIVCKCGCVYTFRWVGNQVVVQKNS